jgi:CRP-like cAMP-binding protein
MALDDHIRILSGVRLFESFTPEQLRLLAFGVEAVRLPAGKKLYREDDAADSAYVVTRGEIGLYRDHDRQYVRIGTAEPGSVLGEMALIAATSRLTSAEATKDSEVLRISKSMFWRILDEYPEMAETLHAQIIEDLQALVSRIEKVGERLD